MVFFYLLIIFLPRTKCGLIPNEEATAFYNLNYGEELVYIPKEFLLLEDETSRIVDRVSDSGLIYEDSSEEDSKVKILLEDGTVKFFAKVSETGLLYDELNEDGQPVESSELVGEQSSGFDGIRK